MPREHLPSPHLTKVQQSCASSLLDPEDYQGLARASDQEVVEARDLAVEGAGEWAQGVVH